MHISGALTDVLAWLDKVDIVAVVALSVVAAYLVAIVSPGWRRRAKMTADIQGRDHADRAQPRGASGSEGPVQRRIPHDRTAAGGWAADNSAYDGWSPAAAGGHVPAWAARRRRGTFVVLSVLLAAGLWIVASVTTDDRAGFLAAREWQAQPFFLAAHFIALRLFASIFAHNYLDASARLDADPRDAERQVARLLGPLGFALAALVALPFCFSDLRYFLARYEKLSGTSIPSTTDWLMYAIWAVEWFVTALIWVILVGALVLNVRAIERHAFRAPIYAVLLERHYRPFLRMGVQGATVALAFGIATLLYIGHAGGEWTDYLGLGTTVLLLAFCFVPPWLAIRRKVDRAVAVEVVRLQTEMQALSEAGHETAATNLADVDARQRTILAMLRLFHLERLHDAVGRREATAVMVRLLAPALTIGWNVWSNGAAVQKGIEIWKRVLG